jgi:NAD(P)H-dependent FMN reductase
MVIVGRRLLMSDAPKILAFAGSTRQESFNKKLVKIAAAGAQAAGAVVTFLDLRDLPLPQYDQDLEDKEGLPSNARKLKDLMLAHDGFLIAAPEYNSSISGVLKNAIDWASRPVPKESPLACFVGKVAAIMSASPGALGGLRGRVAVRSIFENLGTLVVPDHIAIGKAGAAVIEKGLLADPKMEGFVKKLGANLTHTLVKLRA